MDAWIDRVGAFLAPGAGLKAGAEAFGAFLRSRTFLVGSRLSVADVAFWGALQGNLQWDGVRKASGCVAPKAGEAGAWKDSALAPAARHYDALESIPALSALSAERGPRRRFTTPRPVRSDLGTSAGGGNTGSFDVDLGDAEVGKVVTRFPPEPSGFLHIGHAKAAFMNRHIADMYKGRMLVRFDDTNPSKERDEYTKGIIEDVGKLGLKIDGEITYTSDYFPQLFELCERLIAAGHVYADDTPVEQMRQERFDGTPSRRRDRPAAETHRIFVEEMRPGTEEGKKHCLRIKLDMSNPNKALRDPVVYRCSEVPHWRTGTRYRCYPTYDFACPFVDAIEGVTHALRSSEYKDREAQFYRILDLERAVWPELPAVRIWDFSRLSFTYTVLSKRKLTWFVQEGIVDGWDDPRMPTVRGMLRHGLQVEALKEFILSQGASKNVTLQEWDKIWTINKRRIDPVAPRFAAVEDAGRGVVELDNFAEEVLASIDRDANADADAKAAQVAAFAATGNEEQRVVVPKHAKNPDVGTKTQVRRARILLDAADVEEVKDGEEVTLMAWGNAVIRGKKPAGGNDGATDSSTSASASTPLSASVGSAVSASLHLAGDFKKTRLKLTWLPDTPDLVPLELVSLDPLLTKKKLDEGDEFEDFVNRDSRHVTYAHGDPAMAQLEQGDVIQIERKGYFIVDRPARGGQAAILINIPDGRAPKTK